MFFDGKSMARSAQISFFLIALRRGSKTKTDFHVSTFGAADEDFSHRLPSATLVFGFSFLSSEPRASKQKKISKNVQFIDFTLSLSSVFLFVPPRNFHLRQINQIKNTFLMKNIRSSSWIQLAATFISAIYFRYFSRIDVPMPEC